MIIQAPGPSTVRIAPAIKNRKHCTKDTCPCKPEVGSYLTCETQRKQK